MDPIEIWRAARLLVERHGGLAEDRARRRMLDLLRERDAEGVAVWKQILATLGELQRTERREGQAVN
jgi:hypothetical protein